ncbi:hypothetical protein AYI70_g11629 [Smittium culicis]|uniref:GDSL esterase/lipase n=1 Tax=Smittium culicis TaxID=133412 RepID=A0A1R1X101_9FUNG|nr:hypothetical protein AYI70_g11629 [Smittium culicis]
MNICLTGKEQQTGQHFDGKFEKDEIRDDVVGISVGPNDFYNMHDYLGSNIIKIFDLRNRVTSCIIEGVDKLQKMGLRNFIILGFPILRTIPMFQNESPFFRQTLDLFSQYYNSRLSKEIEDYKKNFYKKAKNGDTISIQLIDAVGLQKTLMDNELSTLKYLGIDSMSSACYQNRKFASNINNCLESRTHFYYDEVHPTTIVHAIFGALASKIIKKSPVSYDQDFILKLIKEYNLKNLYNLSAGKYTSNPELYNGPISTSYGISDIVKNIELIIKEKRSKCRIRVSNRVL